MPDVTISAGVAKYALALALDENIRSATMDAYVRGYLANTLFETNAPHLDVSDARPLVLEAMRETVWKAR